MFGSRRNSRRNRDARRSTSAAGIDQRDESQGAPPHKFYGELGDVPTRLLDEASERNAILKIEARSLQHLLNARQCFVSQCFQSLREDLCGHEEREREGLISKESGQRLLLLKPSDPECAALNFVAKNLRGKCTKWKKKFACSSLAPKLPRSNNGQQSADVGDITVPQVGPLGCVLITNRGVRALVLIFAGLPIELTGD